MENLGHLLKQEALPSSLQEANFPRQASEDGTEQRTNMQERKVDVALNIFAKPYQTALSILSLLKYSDRHIDKFYLQFEPAGSRFDPVPPYALVDYLGERVRAFQPEIWLECFPVEKERLTEPEYRQAIRYQWAFERTDKKYLFVMHNDVLVKGDIIGAMLEEIGDAFAIGSIGQCWNCPASNQELMHEIGFSEPCGPERHLIFRPDFTELQKLYELARERDLKHRPYYEGWERRYSQNAWPLPECRVNEWGCLVDVEQTRPLTMPEGGILPFGAYEPCGGTTLDIDVAWFRDLHRAGLRAKNFRLGKYLDHWVGSFRMNRELHMEVELKAQNILLKAFPDFVDWCRVKGNGLF